MVRTVGIPRTTAYGLSDTQCFRSCSATRNEGADHACLHDARGRCCTCRILCAGAEIGSVSPKEIDLLTLVLIIAISLFCLPGWFLLLRSSVIIPQKLDFSDFMSEDGKAAGTLTSDSTNLRHLRDTILMQTTNGFTSRHTVASFPVLWSFVYSDYSSEAEFQRLRE